jgi:hypothetical protein
MKARRAAQAAAQDGEQPQKEESAPADILGAEDDEDVIF